MRLPYGPDAAATTTRQIRVENTVAAQGLAFDVKSRKRPLDSLTDLQAAP
jgi:hypothetical protein